MPNPAHMNRDYIGRVLRLASTDILLYAIFL